MRRCCLFVVLFLLLSPLLSEADTKKEIAKCAAITGDGARLVCYDQLSKRLGVDSPITKQHNIAEKGKWTVDDAINPVDDTRRVILFLEAEAGKSKFGKKVAIVIRCQSNNTELYIAWNDYLGNETEVLTRVGKSKAVTKIWSMASNNTSSFFPDSPVPFLKKMMKHDSLLAQTTPYNESPVTAMFDTKGLSNAIKPLQEACHW